MKYRIVHETTYQYSEPASLSQNELFLHPRETMTQRLVESQLVIVPQPQYLHRRTDYFGNVAHVFMVQQPHTNLAISATCRVTVERPAIPVPADTAPLETVVHRLAAHDQLSTLDAYQFVFASPLITVNPAALSYARPSFPPGTPVLAGAVDLINRIFTEFSYDKSATNVDTSVDQLLASRKGVCQDFAHLGISCLRSLGLAARYVSGYLETKPPPGKPRLVGADASQLYRGMDIGTAKPDAATLALAPHRLIDIRDPGEAYSAAQFRADALREMDLICASGNTPLLVGGTFLYFRALEQGLSGMPPADPAVRARLECEAGERGWAALHARLATVDPQAAARIHANDPQRIQRALEVYELTGRPISDFHDTGRASAMPYEVI